MVRIIKQKALALSSKGKGFVIRLQNRLEQYNPYVRIIRMPMVRRFNRLYYLLRYNTFDNTCFMGKHVMKFPTDLWAYQEIIYKCKPDVIVETGVFLGGSTYYLSKLCEMMGHGRVISVDISLDHVDPDVRALKNVTLILGDTAKAETRDRVQSLLRPNETVMVILDSNHDTDHVYMEMCLFSELVTDGQYMIVEDSIVEDIYPVGFRRGPRKAIKKFVSEKEGFIVDYSGNRFLLTQNDMGYLLCCRKSKMPIEYATPEECFRPVRLWLPGRPFLKVRWERYLNQSLNELH